jgi:class 3 adenylate cyclase
MALKADSATVTGVVMFCDIAGFTEFTHSEGDAAALALLEQFEGIVSGSMPPDARLVKSLGDGALIFVEDSNAALRCAIEQQRSFAAATTAESPLWVRIGAHFGSPLVRGDDLVGHDVNLASRVAAQAFPGEIVVTAELVAVADTEEFAIAEIGPVFVKGVDDAVRLFRVDGVTRYLASP